LPDTNILQTRWLDDEGVAEITDYMPICDDKDKLPRLIRRVRRQQLYLPDTNILQTRWLDDEGVAEITDYMTICDDKDKLPR
ncbi:hypothetical protein HZD82_24365, partial [Pantoea agglomerans]|nr:hypothetical protein [Pantoea agglomerans]